MPTNTNTTATAASLLPTLAALVIIIGGMKIAAPLLVPLLLALFIAILIAFPYEWLHRKGAPRPLALCLVLLVFTVIVTLLVSLLSTSIQEFSTRFPLYQDRIREMTTAILSALPVNLPITNATPPDQLVTDYFDPSVAITLAAAVFTGMQSLLANGFLIMIMVIFLLLEAPTLPAKWLAAHRDTAKAKKSWQRLSTAAKNVNHYMALKTATSLLTGVLIAFLLWLIGVDYPLLWGVMAFLLNYIPNIGSIIAAVPVVLLALVQMGIASAAITAFAYLVVNTLIGNFIEPRIMGKGLGLSTLVVFTSLILWGWVLGVVGMLLSVPLTLAMKIALDSHQNTRWMATMLGPPIADPPAKPEK